MQHGGGRATAARPPGAHEPAAHAAALAAAAVADVLGAGVAAVLAAAARTRPRTARQAHRPVPPVRLAAHGEPLRRTRCHRDHRDGPAEDAGVAAPQRAGLLADPPRRRRHRGPPGHVKGGSGGGTRAPARPDAAAPATHAAPAAARLPLLPTESQRLNRILLNEAKHQYTFLRRHL